MIEVITATFFLTIAILSMVIAIFAFKYAVDAKIKIDAFEKSTHKIEFQPYTNFSHQEVKDSDLEEILDEEGDPKERNSEFDVLKNFKKEVYDRMDTLD